MGGKYVIAAHRVRELLPTLESFNQPLRLCEVTSFSLPKKKLMPREAGILRLDLSHHLAQPLAATVFYTRDFWFLFT